MTDESEDTLPDRDRESERASVRDPDRDQRDDTRAPGTPEADRERTEQSRDELDRVSGR